MFLKYGVKKDNMVSNLTVVILTKNEEMNIVDVIANAKQVTDKVLIVDSGSTDKTVELAKKNGAKVVYRAWDNDFAAQRNFALEHVDTEWVLYLDADERMNEELCKGVKIAVESNFPKQYSIKRKSSAFGKEFNYGVLRPDWVKRLFKRKNVSWVNKVHEKPECNDDIQKINGYIVHFTYNSWEQYFRKFDQYTSIWAENAIDKKTNYFMAFMHALFAFIQMCFVKKGFLDGWLGLVLSANHFTYTLMKYVKLIDLQRRTK